MASDSFQTLKQESESGLAMRKVQLALLHIFDWQGIQKIPDAVGEYVHTPIAERMKKYGVPISQEEAQVLYDYDSDYSEQLVGLAHELAIIGLYKKLEIDTKEAIHIVFPKKSLNKLSKINQLQKFLNNHGIDITKLSGYSQVDELRVLNNCIKHDGKASKQLSQYGQLEEGEVLTKLNKHLFRLGVGAEQYIKALIKELMPHLQSQSKTAIDEKPNK